MADTQITEPVEGQTTQPVSWKEGIHADYLGDVDKFDGTNSLAKGYGELSRKLGSMIAPLTEEATDEQKSNFWNKIGAAQSKDDFKFDLAEGQDDSFLNTMKDMALKDHWTPVQWDNAVATYNDAATGVKEKQTETQAVKEKQIDDLTEKQRVDWGANYDANVDMAKRFNRMHGNEEFDQLLLDSGLHEHPVVIQTFHDLFLKTANDSMIRGELPKEDLFVPSSPSSPEMYTDGEDEVSRKSRDYFTAKGYDYSTGSWNR